MSKKVVVKEDRIIFGEVNAEGEVWSKDLGQTSARRRLPAATEAFVADLDDVADAVASFLSAFGRKCGDDQVLKGGKVTLTFGVSGGGSAGISIVGAKADAFLTVQVEFSASS